MPKEKKDQAPAAPLTPEEQAFEQHQDARKAKVKLFIKRLKWYHIVARRWCWVSSCCS